MNKMDALDYLEARRTFLDNFIRRHKCYHDREQLNMFIIELNTINYCISLIKDDLEKENIIGGDLE